MALFDQLKRFFLGEQDLNHGDTTSDHPQLLRVFLLLEAASSDEEFAAEERNLIDTLLTHKYGLNEAEIEDLLKLAHDKRQAHTDLWSVVREVNNRLSREERIDLMTELWQVLYADQRLDAHEEHFARKMKKLLRLDHSDWLAAKLKARGPA